MRAVSCRFKVNRVSDMGWGHEVEMTPDYGKGRNAEWAAATPSGMMRLTINAEHTDAGSFFEQGKPVAIYITDESVEDADIERIVHEKNVQLAELFELQKTATLKEALVQVDGYRKRLVTQLGDEAE